MKKLLFASLALFGSSYVHAADLSSFGLAGLTSISQETADQVRGQGGLTVVRSVGTSSMAFSIVDSDSGSTFNLNSTLQTTGQDGVEFAGVEITNDDGGTQAVGNTSAGGIQFGSATFEMVDFSFTLDGFSAVTQAQQVAGPGVGLDFSGLLPQL